MRYTLFVQAADEEEEDPPNTKKYASVIQEEDFIEDEELEGWDGAAEQAGIDDDDSVDIQGWDPREDSPYFFQIQ